MKKPMDSGRFRENWGGVYKKLCSLAPPLCGILVLSVLVVLVVGVAVEAQDDPPPSKFRIYQPQFGTSTATEDGGDTADIGGANVISNTTSSGAVWTLRREFTYGDAGTTISVMALTLVNVLAFVYNVVRVRYDW